MSSLNSWARSAQAPLMMAVCFVLPMRVSYVYFLSGLLLIAVLFSGGLRERLAGAINSRPCQMALAYFAVVLVSLLWTENIKTGWHFLGRHVPFLLFGLYWSVSGISGRERGLGAFVSGLVVCALMAHYNWLQQFHFPDWPRGVRVFKSVEDTAPFVDRIMYAPMLALGACIALDRLLSGWRKDRVFLWFSAFFLLLSNLAFSGGRAGVVAFATMLVLMIFMRAKSWPRALAVSSLTIIFVFGSLYSISSYFRERTDSAVDNIRVFEKYHHTSVGERFIYWNTSARVFLNNPLLGVGAGDFQSEYVKARPARWADTPDSYNPHNQFLLTAATTGLLGLGILGCFFLSLLRSSSDRRTLVLMSGFLVASMFESYLWRSNTSLAFMVLMAVTVAPGLAIPGARQ